MDAGISEASAPHRSKSPKRRITLWLKRIIFGLFIALILLILAGYIYQAIGASSDRRTYTAPGQLVDLGGYSLHLYCTGPLDSGNPTVILESLSGGLSPNWAWVQPEVAKVTRVCSYDRAGWGWSEPSTAPISLEGTVSDLHQLLQKAQVPSPYVLVGHSIGGIYMRKYAAEHPDEVAGIVLVDSSHPDQFERYPELLSGNEDYQRWLTIFPFLARIGLFRLYFASGGEFDFAGLPPRQHDEVAAFWSSPEYFARAREETSSFLDIYTAAQSLGSLGDLPLFVISQGKNPPAGWSELQAELALLSSDSLHVTLPEATHASLALDKEDAAKTSHGILQVVEAAHNGEPLSH